MFIVFFYNVQSQFINRHHTDRFVFQAMWTRGISIICSISLQPIFHENSITDIEITFLATRLRVEGNGMAVWLMYHSLNSFKSMKFHNIYVQSCTSVKTMAFYHKLGAVVSIHSNIICT